MKLLHPGADAAARLRNLVRLPVVGFLDDLGLAFQLVEALLQCRHGGLQLADFVCMDRRCHACRSQHDSCDSGCHGTDLELLLVHCVLTLC